jgi:hypothetical protein
MRFEVSLDSLARAHNFFVFHLLNDFKKIVLKQGYVSINDYFIKLIIFCGFESLAKNSQKFAIFFPSNLH